MKSNQMKILALTLLAFSSLGAAPRPTMVGLKNFREILASLEEATGISAKTDAVVATYRKVVGRLPVTGDVAELGAPTVLAMVELSGVFCNQLVQKEANLDPSARRFFLFVDFVRGQDQFTASGWKQIMTDLATSFWQRSPTADEMVNLNKLLDAYKKEDVSSTVTQQALQGACIQIGSSLAFLTNGS